MAIYDNVFDELMDAINELRERAARRKYTPNEHVIYMSNDFYMRLRVAEDKFRHRGYIDGVESVLGCKLFCLQHVFEEEHPNFRVVEI